MGLTSVRNSLRDWKDLDRKKKAFQKLWVAGTLGAFFSALAKTLPGHLSEMTFQPNWLYTADVFIRYGYLSWSVTYFFTTHLRIDNPNYKPTRKDIVFDVIQSVLGLTGAVALGFVVTQPYSLNIAYGFGNGVILLIALAAWLLFRNEGGLGRLRIAAAIAAAIPMIIALGWASNAWWFFGLMGAVVLAMLVLLAVFVLAKMKEEFTTQPKAATPEAPKAIAHSSTLS